MRTRVVLASSVLLLAACSGGDDDPDAVDTTTTTAAAADACAPTELTFTNLDTSESVEFTSTAAASLGAGSAYTAYAADFDVAPEDISLFGDLDVPDGGNVVTVFVTVLNPEDDLQPLEVGTEIEHESEVFGVLTFLVTHQVGEEVFGSNAGGEGTLTLTGVGDTLCFEVDYHDDEKELSGTYTAEVNALS